MTVQHLGPNSTCQNLVSCPPFCFQLPGSDQSHINSYLDLQGVSNGLPHTTYRLPLGTPRVLVYKLIFMCRFLSGYHSFMSGTHCPQSTPAASSSWTILPHPIWRPWEASDVFGKTAVILIYNRMSSGHCFHVLGDLLYLEAPPSAAP